MKINKKVLNGVLGAGVLGVVLIGGAFAYLTDNEAYTNQVTIGDVTVDLVQSNVLKDTDVVVPNQELEVEPYIVNTGTNDAVVFMEVVVPITDAASIVSLSGMAQTGIVKLFTINYDSSNIDTTNWEYVETRVYDSNDKYLGSDETASGAATVGYVCGYKTAIEEGDDTTPLFTNIKAANFTEAYGNSTTVDIPIKIYAIQADFVYGSNAQVAPGGADTTTTTTYVTDLDADGLKKIFNTFVNQNYDSINTSNLNDADIHGSLDIEGNSN